MKYYIANFTKALPIISGMTLVCSCDIYQLYSLTDEALTQNPFEGVPHEEITELEGTTAWKYYGEVRGYRSAYSDVEGLEPDPESLAKGKRKTKVYITPEIEAATVLLMKRIFKKNVQDVFAKREDKSQEQNLLAFIDSLNSIKDICYEKERLLGIEMSKTQLQELGLWDDETNSRKGRMIFELGF